MLGCDAGTYEGQQVGIDQVCMRGRHPVRQAGVGFKRPMLQKLDGPCSGRGERANLVVLAMHHQDRNVDHLEIVVKLGLGKGFDAVIRQFCTRWNSGNQTSRLAALSEGAFGLFHR